MYFDARKSCKVVKFKVGDNVKVKAPVGCQNWSKFSCVKRVIKLFKNAVKTNDGRIWNHSRVVHIKPNHNNTCVSESADGASSSLERESTRKSARISKIPGFLNDIVRY